MKKAVPESRPVLSPTPQAVPENTEATPHVSALIMLPQHSLRPSAIPSSSEAATPSMPPPETAVPDRAPMDQDDEDEPMPTIDMDSDSD